MSKSLVILFASLTVLVLGHTVPVVTTMPPKRPREAYGNDEYTPGQQPEGSERARAARLRRARLAQSPTDLAAERDRNAARMRSARATARGLQMQQPEPISLGPRIRTQSARQLARDEGAVEQAPVVTPNRRTASGLPLLRMIRTNQPAQVRNETRANTVQRRKRRRQLQPNAQERIRQEDAAQHATSRAQLQPERRQQLNQTNASQMAAARAQQTEEQRRLVNQTNASQMAAARAQQTEENVD